MTPCQCEIVSRLRFNLIVAASLTCVLFVTSCGSAPRSTQSEERTKVAASSTAPAAPPASNRDNWPVIAAFGDSLTAGVAGRSYPDQLQDLLDRNGYRYRVDNQGVSGDTTTDGLARIDNVIAEKPVLVILEFGGNDGLRGVPVAEIRANLQEIIAKLKAANLPIVLLGITLPPNYGPDYVKQFTNMYAELAKQNNLRYFPFLLLHVYQHRDMMQPDGIHPNGIGNQVVASDVFGLIRPLLAKQ
jgi:acyl-CoA thioesterase-1